LDTVELVERCAEGINRDEELEEWNELAELLESVHGHYFACYVDSWGPIDYDLLASTEAAGAVYGVSFGQLDAFGRLHAQDLSRVAARCARAVHLFLGGTEDNVGDTDEEAAQCDLIRDVVQHPELAATVAPEWKTETVVSLARGIYDQRAFDRMPILADALEEAGCDDPTILRHCRADVPHVRGCWVVDQVLGLE